MLTLDKVYKASHVLKEVLAPTQCIKAKRSIPTLTFTSKRKICR